MRLKPKNEIMEVLARENMSKYFLKLERTVKAQRETQKSKNSRSQMEWVWESLGICFKNNLGIIDGNNLWEKVGGIGHMMKHDHMLIVFEAEQQELFFLLLYMLETFHNKIFNIR